jgi:hypothetical protein
MGIGTPICMSTAATAGTLQTLYSFTAADHVPTAGARLAIDAKGNLYGTTVYDHGGGIIYELSPPKPPSTTWTKTTLYTFQDCITSCPLGALPEGHLVLGKAGHLYGVALVGGAYGGGLVYEVVPSKNAKKPATYTDIYDFQGTQSGSTDGYGPIGLTIDRSGTVYGVTTNSGLTYPGCPATGMGTVFSLNPPGNGSTAWTESVLATIPYAVSSHCYPYGVPSGGPTLDRRGNLFVAIQSLNEFGYGAVDEALKPAQAGTWTLNQVHMFTGLGIGGNGPDNDTCCLAPGLVFDTAGNLYGAGGSGYAAAGTVFELTPPAGHGARGMRLRQSLFGTV